MNRLTSGAVVLALLAAPAVAEDVVTAVHGTISEIDARAKTMVIKAADGTAQTMRVTEKTAVHGVEAAGRATDTVAKDSYRGLRTGTEVVAHYTARGTEKTLEEVDNVGRDGLKAVGGTVKELDRGAKKLVVTAADGTEHTFTLTDHAAVAAGKDMEKGAVKSTKVTVYYTETAGKQVAHFFERI
jgi:hypothetical protein